MNQDPRAQEDWADRPLSRAIGWKQLLSWDAKQRAVRIRFQAREEFCHTNGTIVQGGFITAWLDSSMANAIVHDTASEQNIASLELKVSFLAAVPQGEFVAEGRVLRRGKRVAFLEARLTDLSGERLYATATSTGLLVPYNAG